jgi:hypothetical protein
MQLIYPTPEETGVVETNNVLKNICKDSELNDFILNPKTASQELFNTVEKLNNTNSHRIKQKDDLTRIFGIGPVFEERLNKHGIYTYSDLSNKGSYQIRDILNPNGILKIDILRIVKEAYAFNLEKGISDKPKKENLDFEVSQKIINAFDNTSINRVVTFQVVLQLIELSVNVQDYNEPTLPEDAYFILGNLTLIPETKTIIVNAQVGIDFENYDEIVIWKSSDEKFQPNEYMYDMVFIDNTAQKYLDSPYIIQKEDIREDGLLLND